MVERCRLAVRDGALASGALTLAPMSLPRSSSAALLAFLLSACSGSSASPPPCSTDGDCASGRCVSMRCEPCGPTLACAGGLHCLRVEDELGERRECAAECDPDAGRRAPEGHACVGGAVVRCEAGAPAAACWQCARELDRDLCPAGTYCISGIEAGECVPQLGEGYSCTDNRTCLSLNCSSGPLDGPGGCEPVAGTACTEEGGECRICDATPEGGRCAQSCQSALACAEDQRCIELSDDFACRDLCASSTDCADGYECRPVRGDAEMTSVCVPSATGAP
jgi:hypothetical protein